MNVLYVMSHSVKFVYMEKLLESTPDKGVGLNVGYIGARGGRTHSCDSDN